MKPCSSLFPSYYFSNDDEAVFFELSDHSHLFRIDLNDYKDENDAGMDTTSNGAITNMIPEDVLQTFTGITGSSGLVNLLIRSKNESNSYGRKIFEELRGKTNPYEGLSKGCFLNRSAMKLINLDYVFSLIEPRETSAATEKSHFSFVDLCGGPGGFVECVLLKCRYLGTAVTGFGMTLLIDEEEPGKREFMTHCNWNITHLDDPPYSAVIVDKDYDGTSNNGNEIIEECECKVYLVSGPTGTGDICERNNINSLDEILQRKLPSVCTSTVEGTSREEGATSEEGSGDNDRKFVDFVCSDGFDHEISAFRIVLCQVIGMIKTLRVGGNFVMKVFSCTKEHTLKLFILLSQLFQKITLTKPVTSRPVSGERFFVAINLHSISLKERRIIEEKLWTLCGEIAVWEREKEGETEEEEINDMKDNNNDSNGSNGSNGNNDRNNDDENSIPIPKDIPESREKTERKEDNIFHINWPFYISNEIFITASEYLTDMNNSHILTQLISLYKIIVLARERGCEIVDADLVYELGSLRIPVIQEHVRTYVDSHGISHTKETSNDYDDYDNHLKDNSSSQKLNKHRIATNKKRRKNKNKNKNKVLNLHYNDALFDNHKDMAKYGTNCLNLNEKKHEFLNIHENGNFNKNEIENLNENNGNDDRKVRFSVNDQSILSITGESLLPQTTDNVNMDINWNNKVDNVYKMNEDYDNNTIVHKSDDSNDGNDDNELYDDNYEYDSKYTIKDIVNMEEKSKPIKVHEYFKKWRIYDLDVVY